VSVTSWWNRWLGRSDVKPISDLPRRLRWGAVTDIGTVRENNEDRYFVHSNGHYFLVADGMGGQSAGEKASEIAADVIPKRLDQLLNFKSDDPEKVAASIDEAIARANADIMALGELDPSLHSMGTTVAMLVAVANRLYAAGIGDSRVYRLRGKELQQLTKDHTLTEMLRESGTITSEEAAHHRFKNVLTRYLGSKEGGTGANTQSFDVYPGDRFVLCSDGVTEGVSNDLLKQILKSESDPQKAAQAIGAAAKEGGSRDNITCVTVFVA